MSVKETMYTVELRKDQFDLIVMGLTRIREMSLGGESAYAVDRVGRKFLRRCIDETVKDIQSQVPGE